MLVSSHSEGRSLLATPLSTLIIIGLQAFLPHHDSSNQPVSGHNIRYLPYADP